MYEILSELNKTQGIRGSMIVGEDGIIVAAEIGGEFEDDTVGALAASIIASVKKALTRLHEGAMRQVMIEADNGKIFLAECPIGILVVLTGIDINIGLIRLEIKTALDNMRNVPVMSNQ
ncbi:MAG: hypothetical protein GF315_11355 [candidate division Zixibacteria bacterium]|nr:hypothetical protein [candidate division Zixibacteria bacterium]